MNSNDFYKLKYLKYKNKYITLKKNIYLNKTVEKRLNTCLL